MVRLVPCPHSAGRGAGGDAAASSSAAADALSRRSVRPVLQRADDAARQEQRHRDEQAAEHEQPVRREHAGGEVGLGVVDQHRAEHRAGQRAAAADRDPDHRLDGIGRREFARIDDADLRHVERAGDARHAGRQREHEQLVGFDAIAEEARARLGVADGDQHLAEFRGDDGAADQEADA